MVIQLKHRLSKQEKLVIIHTQEYTICYSYDTHKNTQYVTVTTHTIIHNMLLLRHVQGYTICYCYDTHNNTQYVTVTTHTKIHNMLLLRHTQ